jgi:hypothetical protein
VRCQQKQKSRRKTAFLFIGGGTTPITAGGGLQLALIRHCQSDNRSLKSDGKQMEFQVHSCLYTAMSKRISLYFNGLFKEAYAQSQKSKTLNHQGI